jgi:hypothetical protein
MKKSEETKELIGAMILAQGDIEAVVKDATNPHFKSKYANLTSCIQAIKPALVKHKLLLLQEVINGDDAFKVGVRTLVAHESGQFIETEVFVKLKNETNPQDAGSAFTYLRRYALASLFNLEQEDDDANKVSTPDIALPKNKTPVKPIGTPVFDGRVYIASRKLDKEQLEIIGEYIKSHNLIFADMQKIEIDSMIQTCLGEV